jgi:type I restriction enzyme S subunit
MMTKDWQVVSLAEVCERPQYGAIAKGSDQPIGPRFVRQTDIVTGRIDWTTVPFCDLALDEIPKYAIHPGDLLISRLGAGVGTAATVRDTHEAVFAGYLVRFQAVAEQADPAYLGYQLHSPAWWRHVNGFRSGAAQPTLNAQQMGAFRFRLPPLSEQRRIAAVLGALDDLIETNRLQVIRLEALARMVAASSPDEVELSEFARALNSRQVRPAGSVEHYSLPAFDTGAEPERIDGEQIQSNKLPLTEPCVLVSRLNPRWERCWMTYPGANAVASTEFVPLVCTEATPEEVWAVTSAPAFWEQMRTHVTGTTGSHQRVEKSAVLTLTVSDVRTLDESSRHLVQQLVRGARAARDEIAELTRARDELLPLLMSGKVRVSEDLAVA